MGNTNNISSYVKPEKLPYTKLQSIPLWLKAQTLFKSLTDDSIIDNVMNQMIESTTNKSIIKMLIDSATTDILNKFVEILKHAQNQQITLVNNNAANIDNDSSRLMQLPTESINNICDFLTRQDQIRCKLISSSYSISR